VRRRHEDPGTAGSGASHPGDTAVLYAERRRSSRLASRRASGRARCLRGYNQGDPGICVGDGEDGLEQDDGLERQLPLGHDGYFKTWALGRPRLQADYLLLDEAQDTNPVVIKLLRRQSAMSGIGTKKSTNGAAQSTR
jgi:hypothetical protein